MNSIKVFWTWLKEIPPRGKMDLVVLLLYLIGTVGEGMLAAWYAYHESIGGETIGVVGVVSVGYFALRIQERFLDTDYSKETKRS